MTEALLDNDILYKTAMYGLTTSLLNAAPFGADQFHMLGAAKYMVSKRLTKKPPTRGSEQATAEFHAALERIKELEPTNEETKLAAELEFLASELNLELDGGESLLCAVLIMRAAGYLFTGDKRAIKAVACLLADEKAACLARKLVCLEQLIVAILQTGDATNVRAAICGEPNVDKALTNCFGCHSKFPQEASWREGLASYIHDLQNAAPGALATGA